MVSDALHRLATLFGVDIFDFELLSGFAARVISAKLAAGAALSAVSDGARNRTDDHEYEGCHRSSDRQGNCFCPHAEIPRGFEAGQSRSHEISQAPDRK